MYRGGIEESCIFNKNLPLSLFPKSVGPVNETRLLKCTIIAFLRDIVRSAVHVIGPARHSNKSAQSGKTTSGCTGKAASHTTEEEKKQENTAKELEH